MLGIERCSDCGCAEKGHNEDEAGFRGWRFEPIMRGEHGERSVNHCHDRREDADIIAQEIHGPHGNIWGVGLSSIISPHLQSGTRCSGPEVCMAKQGVLARPDYLHQSHRNHPRVKA
jgi:hypothetical protein